MCSYIKLRTGLLVRLTETTLHSYSVNERIYEYACGRHLDYRKHPTHYRVSDDKPFR